MAYKTPGVYVEEISKFPPSVAQVATAIPAFIGYTEKAVDQDGKSLAYQPTKIDSLAEYELLFGGAWEPPHYIYSIDGNGNVDVTIQKFYLYESLRSFYDNGGGDCYIVSVGDYEDTISYNDTSGASPQGLKPGLDTLLKVDEPTLLLFPDAVGTIADGTNALDLAELGSLQAQTLMQCAKLQDRFGVFDIAEGFEDDDQHVLDFRDNIGTANLKYGAAYNPWLQTIYQKVIWLRDIYDTTVAPGNNLFDAIAAPTSANLLNIYNNYSSAVQQTDQIVGVLTDVDIDDFDDLEAKVDELIAEIKALPTSSPAAITNAFVTILTLLREAALAFEAIKAVGLGVDISKALERQEEDVALADQIVDLIAFEKNADLITISDMADAPAVVAAYAVLDGTEWINGTADHADVGAAIPANTDFEFADDAANTKTKVLEAIGYLKNSVQYQKILSELESLFDSALLNEEIAQQLILGSFPLASKVMKALERNMRLIPPSGTIVGIYAQVDATRGVWKAPANVSISSVVGPAYKITSKEQEDLNVHTTGKSINAIRSFAGKGTLVWGARTLAGNDNEWRYVSVRRFYNMVEESTMKASEQFVFEPNDANTWVKVRAMIENFLILQWRAGALQGATPEQAFFVRVGLGETMTSLDILEGRMNVEIGLAVVRPAEFIILKFSHKMAVS
jgi:phage tail sheath protein FI